MAIRGKGTLTENSRVYDLATEGSDLLGGHPHSNTSLSIQRWVLASKGPYLPYTINGMMMHGKVQMNENQLEINLRSYKAQKNEIRL